MNTKKRINPIRPFLLSTAAAVLIPVNTFAQGAEGHHSILPVEMSILTFLILGSLLLFSIVFTFKYKSRVNVVDSEFRDITTELEHARQRLTETSQTLEKTELNLKHTTQRYQGILFDAQVGMFQVDLDGKCTYVNSALQEISGLYLKKALKDGLESAIHPDDRSGFSSAWKGFVDKDQPFTLPFRFQHSNGREVHVMCVANKVFNERKKVESYIGWVSNTTQFHEQNAQAHAETARYTRFIEETVEGYYHLAPEAPIPLIESADKMAVAIVEKFKLTACNETFAGLYGTAPTTLLGKGINNLQDGCGPFKNKDAVKKLVKAQFKLINTESVRQDPRGNRLNLINNVIGIVEDNKLVGIWGAQRNITQQKRELAELSSQAGFMHRILDALPADVHVKDTRCRYLYASRKLAARTGIAQEDWIGKTIFEVLPATPRDHDKPAIEVMKSGKLNRAERSYETRKKSGWLETTQIPLVSEDGLIEGVVGLSIETSARRKKEEEILNSKKQLEQQLQLRSNELSKSQEEYGKASTSLSSTTQELRIREAELENQRNEFEAQLNDHKHAEEQLEQQLQHRTSELSKSQEEHGKASTSLHKTTQSLRIREAELENQRNEFETQLKDRKHAEEQLKKNEKTLLTRQQQLEEQLNGRLTELEAETDKRKKWEELLSIKETDLRKFEEAASNRSKELEKEIAQRKQTESNLESNRAELEKYRDDLQSVESKYKLEIANLTQKQQREYGNEHHARTAVEQHLKKTQTALKEAQSRIQALIEQHASELEHEVAERKTASAKLIQHAEELDELKRKFNERIEQETKELKKELAQKQIHEKALRQQGKDLESRIKQLEKMLQMKAQETNKQVQAREGAEVQRQQIEQQLEHLTSHQKQLVERETQKLNLQIAEIRLEEIKLRKAVGDLEQKKEGLEKEAQARDVELEKLSQEKEKLSTTLSGTQDKLKKLKSGQTALIAKETQALQNELKQLKQSECDLRKQEELLVKQGGKLEQTIEKMSGDVKAEVQKREAVEKTLKELQIAFDASQNNVGTLIKEQTFKLEEQIKQHKKTEMDLKNAETALKHEAQHLQKTIDKRSNELAKAQQEREKAEKQLADVVERSSQGTREIEARIADIQQGHAAELKRITDEQAAELKRVTDEKVTELKHAANEKNAEIKRVTKESAAEVKQIKDEQKELRQKEKYYRTLFQASTDAFLQIDLKSGQIQSANQAAATLFGEKDVKNLTGKTIDALSPEHQPDHTPSADMAKARLHTAMESGRESFEWQFRKTESEFFHGLVSLSTIQIDKNQLILAVINDISELKQRQAELEQTIVEAHAANEMNSRIVDELTESVETTLDPVLESAVSIEEAENITDEQKQEIGIINLNCRTLIDTMHYRSELSHMADGSDELKPAKCDLHGLIKELNENFSHRAETKKLFFALSYAQYQSSNNVPKFVETDGHKVRTSLGILLGYALAHTEKGRLGLHAARKSNDGDTLSVAFELTYTGNQERDELLSSAFDPDNNGAEEMEFGLTLARRYIRMLGGDVTLEYRQSDITALTVIMPFKKVASEIVMPGQNAEPKAGAA